jgi:hypothetical protein
MHDLTLALTKTLERIGELTPAERDRFFTLVHESARDGHTPALDFADLLSQRIAGLEAQRRPSSLLPSLYAFRRLAEFTESGSRDKPIAPSWLVQRLERGKGNLVVARALEDLGWKMAEEEIRTWLATVDGQVTTTAGFALGQAFARATSERDKGLRRALIADLQLAVSKYDGPEALQRLLARLS